MAYNCNTCGSQANHELFRVGKHEVVQCTACNLVYIANPMAVEETRTHYEEEYYSGENGTASTSCYGQAELFRIKEADDRLDKLGKLDSLLDVGCGMGFFVKAASKRGIRAVGIDLSQNAVDYGKSRGLDLRQGDLLYSDHFKDESFDVITFWASVEHLYRPRETLQKARDLLKPDGLIVLETGNFDSYLARLTGSRWRLIQPDHNFYYSSATLDDVLDRVGFSTIRTDNDGFVESMITQFGLRDFILKKFVQGSADTKQMSSSLKEKINKFAARLQLGDIMIKYARKK